MWGTKSEAHVMTVETRRRDGLQRCSGVCAGVEASCSSSSQSVSLGLGKRDFSIITVSFLIMFACLTSLDLVTNKYCLH